jgi:hypothetical protein
VPRRIQQVFRGRKEYPTQNVVWLLSVVTFYFTYVLARWEGFAHDATILADAKIMFFKPMMLEAEAYLLYEP